MKVDQRNAIRQLLCVGFFNNVARKKDGAGFHTMDGHASSVSIHPGSVLAGPDREEQLTWVIFREVMWTSKAFMRTVTPIDYSWVRDLLPRLHKVDIAITRGKTTIAPVVADPPLQLSDYKVEKRNDEVSVAAARYTHKKDVYFLYEVYSNHFS